MVRRLVGYDRFAGVAAARVLGRLFEVARLHVSFFQPSFKLRDKTRDGAKVTRRYSPPLTPCERLLAHPAVSDPTKDKLRRLRVDLDSVKLLKKLRVAQADLASLTSAGNGEAHADASLESFLAKLPNLWREGECRPTHRPRAPRPRTWRARADPFAVVWPQVQEWLEQEPDITGKALFESLREKFPGEFAPGQLRTLQRRVREWRQAMAKRLLGISSSVTETSSPTDSSLAPPEAPHAPQGERGLHERRTTHLQDVALA